MHTESAIYRNTTRQGLEKILASPDLDTLRWMTLTSGKQSAYNLMRVNWVFAGKTVEFRQHEGTLDGEAVVNWIIFVVKLMEAATIIEENELVKKLWEVVELEEKGKKVSVFHLMRTLLNCPEVADYYEIRG